MIKEQGVAKSCAPHHVTIGDQKIRELQRIGRL